MPNRLDIELTSARGDGSYTWRAAGARQPKGVIDGKILSDSAKVGDVLRVEAEVEIDGITILSVLPSKEKAAEAGRIELLGSSKPVAAVTTVLVSEGGRNRGDRRDLLDSPRRGGGPGGRDRRPARGGERPDTRRPQAAEGGTETRDGRPERHPRSDGAQSTSSSPAGAARPARPTGDRRPERRPRVEGTPGGGSATSATAPSGQRRPRTGPGSGPRPGTPVGERNRTEAGSAARPQSAPRRTPPRFEPGSAHRDLLLAGLAPEQRPIAERLAAGGIPAVRRAIAEERERARSEGRPEVSGEAILALAEQLAPSVKQATWLDRAEAAVAQLEQISLRDLRTTVASAAPRDETARELDRKLREELERRVKKLRTTWEEQITHALDENRVLQALRFSAQPPEPTARFPAILVERLATTAGAAMTTTTPLERWLALLDAAVASPIRRQIHPAGLPEDATGEIVRKARVAAGSIPALAPMLGLSMPPPPKPIRSSRPPRPPRPPSRAARRPAPPIHGVAKPVSSVADPSADVSPSESPLESPTGAAEATTAPGVPQEGSGRQEAFGHIESEPPEFEAAPEVDVVVPSAGDEGEAESLRIEAVQEAARDEIEVETPVIETGGSESEATSVPEAVFPEDVFPGALQGDQTGLDQGDHEVSATEQTELASRELPTP